MTALWPSGQDTRFATVGSPGLILAMSNCSFHGNRSYKISLMQSIKSAAKILNILNYFHLETYRIDQDARDGLSPIDTPRPSTLKSYIRPCFRQITEAKLNWFLSIVHADIIILNVKKVQKSNMYLSKQNKMKGILWISVTWWWRYHFLDWLYWMQIRFAGWYFTLSISQNISKSKYLKIQHIQTKITCFNLFIYLIIIWRPHNESLPLFTQCHFGEYLL